MPRLILFNKPYGVLCQFSDTEGRPVLADYIPLPHVYPAGRLDHDSEGLLLLTDDGGLQHKISDPRWKQPKTYWVQVDGDINDAAIEQLTQGLELKDGPTLPAKAHKIAEPEGLWPRQPPVRYRAQIPTSWLSLTITEGRNRQVRRMTAAVGFPTLRLIRAAIGEWSLEGLAAGEWREIQLDEAVWGGSSSPTPRASTRSRSPIRATTKSDPNPFKRYQPADTRPPRRKPR